MLVRKNFVIFNRFYYIISLRSLFLSYNYFLFLYYFVDNFFDFKVFCYNFKLKLIILNSKYISSIFSNSKFFNFFKSKFVLVYSLNFDFFGSFLDFIKEKDYLKIFAISFKNYFLNVDLIFDLYSKNLYGLLYKFFFSGYLFIHLFISIISYIFNVLKFIL